MMTRVAARIARLRCPACGTVQPIHSRSGRKSRVRSVAYVENCTQCETPLRMIHAPGGALREGLGWGLAFVVLAGVAVLLAGGDGTARISWPLFLVGMAALYGFGVVVTALIMGRSRQMVKA